MCEFVHLFTEGLDTPDLNEARALLEELRALSPGRGGLVSVYRIGNGNVARHMAMQAAISRRSGALTTHATSSNTTEIDRWGAFGRGVNGPHDFS
jgi:hypothetical protein